MGEIERERGRERKLINVSIEKKKIVICVARASMVLFSLGEINKNIPGNFERSLTSNTLYQHLCKSPSPQVTQAWIRVLSTQHSGHFIGQMKRNVYLIGLTGILETSFEDGPLWPVWLDRIDKIVVPSTVLLYPAYLLDWKKKSRIPSRGFRLSDDVTKHASSNRVHNVHLHIKNSKLFTSKWYKDRC